MKNIISWVHTRKKHFFRLSLIGSKAISIENICKIVNHYFFTCCGKFTSHIKPLLWTNPSQRNTVRITCHIFLAPLFLHWCLMIITDSVKWNSKLEAQLTFWWLQGFWSIRREGKESKVAGGGGRIRKRPAGLLMWGMEHGGLRQPREVLPSLHVFTLWIHV